MNVRRTDLLIRATLIVALVIVCLNAWLAFRSVKILNDSQHWVSHTWQVIDTLERIIGSLKSAETGYRGYLMTGDSAYIDPYTSAVKEIPQEFSELASLTADNPMREKEITAMRTLVGKRIAVLQSAMGRLEAGEKDKAGLLKESGTGKTELDSFRANRALMPLNHPRYRCQPNPRALEVPLAMQALEGVEELADVLHIKPGAVVADEKLAGLRGTTEFDQRLRVARAELDRIAKKILQRHPQQPGIGIGLKSGFNAEDQVPMGILRA